MTNYLVKKFGVVTEWTHKLKEAQEAFKETSPGEAELIKLDGSQQVLLQHK